MEVEHLERYPEQIYHIVQNMFKYEDPDNNGYLSEEELERTFFFKAIKDEL